MTNTLNQFLSLAFESICGKFQAKTAYFEVSTARYLKTPDIDLWPNHDLTRYLNSGT